MGALVPSHHKKPTFSEGENQWQLQQTCKKTFTFTAGCYADYFKNCTGIDFHARKASREKNHCPFSCQGNLPLLIQFPGHTGFSWKASVGCSFWFILLYYLNCLWWKSNWTIPHVYGNPGQGENAKWVIVSVKADNFKLSFPLSSSASLFYWGSMEH